MKKGISLFRLPINYVYVKKIIKMLRLVDFQIAKCDQTTKKKVACKHFTLILSVFCDYRQTNFSLVRLMHKIN